MKKTLLFILLNVVSLYAAQTTQKEMNGIYMEALLFVAVFGTMGLISYIYSSRHAKIYSSSEAEKKRKKDEKEEQLHNKKRVASLTKLLEDELLTPQEFAILTRHYT
jgi:amino acid permease